MVFSVPFLYALTPHVTRVKAYIDVHGQKVVENWKLELFVQLVWATTAIYKTRRTIGLSTEAFPIETILKTFASVSTEAIRLRLLNSCI